VVWRRGPLAQPPVVHAMFAAMVKLQDRLVGLRIAVEQYSAVRRGYRGAGSIEIEIIPQWGNKIGRACKNCHAIYVHAGATIWWVS
jgi:hypothetical protein